jgi:hypothetical protein
LAKVRLDIPQAYKKANFDTIKLSYKTVERLRHCYFNNHEDRQNSLTYDELVNMLIDKVESEDKLKIMKVNNQ